MLLYNLLPFCLIILNLFYKLANEKEGKTNNGIFFSKQFVFSFVIDFIDIIKEIDRIVKNYIYT